MRQAFRLLTTDLQGRPLPSGARLLGLVLGYVAAAALLADLLLYAVDLRAQGPLSPGAIGRAVLPVLAGASLILATIPPIAALRRRHAWRSALLSILTLVVSGAVALPLVALLHDDCVRISGCTQRATVIYFVSFAQFLYFTAFLAVWIAVLFGLGRALWLSARGGE